MASSSSSSTLSNPPSYPGLHSVSLLKPKSPGSHSAREDAATWDAWQLEIQELVDFLRTETPPVPHVSPTKRGSRELLRSGSRHLRQSLRGRQLRNTWGSRQIRSFMGKPEQRFCHIVQDPEFLKDMADPGMYLINCNARALGRGLAERNSKGSVDWKTLRVSDLSTDVDPDATLCGIPDPPRVPRVLSKRLPLNSHPSRGHVQMVTSRANKENVTTARVSTPRMRGAGPTSFEHDALLPEVPTATFDPFAPVTSETPAVARKPMRADPPKIHVATKKLETNEAKTNVTVRSVPSRDHLSAGTPAEPATDVTPASSVVHLPPVPPTPRLDTIWHQRSFPVAKHQQSPPTTASTGTAPFLSLKGSYEDGFPGHISSKPAASGSSDDEALTAPNKPWLESGLTPKQPWRLREHSYATPSRIPAPAASTPNSITATLGSETGATSNNYGIAQNIWKANAAQARRRMATRIDTTRRLKQRDFERARGAATVTVTKEVTITNEMRPRMNSNDERPPGTSHSAHSEPMVPVTGRCDVTSLPLPRTMRLQRAISYDGHDGGQDAHEETEPATSRALDWYAKSPVGQTANPWNEDIAPPATAITNTGSEAEKIFVEHDHETEARIQLKQELKLEEAKSSALSSVYTVAERAPSLSPKRTSSRRIPKVKTAYRSRGIQCSMEKDSGAANGAEASPSVCEGLETASMAASPPSPDLSRLETRLEQQLATMDQRTKMLESLLLSFVRKAASRETVLGWDALSKAAATMSVDQSVSGSDTRGGSVGGVADRGEGLPSAAALLGRTNEAGMV